MPEEIHWKSLPHLKDATDTLIKTIAELNWAVDDVFIIQFKAVIERATDPEQIYALAGLLPLIDNVVTMKWVSTIKKNQETLESIARNHSLPCPPAAGRKCFRKACKSFHATCLHTHSCDFYCVKCARAINEHNPGLVLWPMSRGLKGDGIEIIDAVDFVKPEYSNVYTADDGSGCWCTPDWYDPAPIDLSFGSGGIPPRVKDRPKWATHVKWFSN